MVHARLTGIHFYFYVMQGTFTIFNHYSVHFNETLWKEPETFKPDRFLDENMKIINTENMIPFGLGKFAYEIVLKLKMCVSVPAEKMFGAHLE